MSKVGLRAKKLECCSKATLGDKRFKIFDYFHEVFHLFHLISAVHCAKSKRWVTEPKTFLCISESAADADSAAVNSNGSSPRYPPKCTALDNLVFDSLILADKLIAKVLQKSSTCLLVNNNLCEKLVSSSEFPIIFDDILKLHQVLKFT